MAEPFTLELPGGLRWVIEPPAGPDDDDYVRTARVRIQAPGLDAQATVALSGGPWNPAGFLTGLAADWWAGTRHWKALEGEMEIAASHDGARVLIAVTVRRPATALAEDAWFARIAFGLEPGEQLAAAARDLAAALAW